MLSTSEGYGGQSSVDSYLMIVGVYIQNQHVDLNPSYKYILSHYFCGAQTRISDFDYFR